MSPRVFLLVMLVELTLAVILPTAEDRERGRSMDSICDACERAREEAKEQGDER